VLFVTSTQIHQGKTSDDEMDTGEGTDRDNGNAESEGMGEDESADESAG